MNRRTFVGTGAAVTIGALAGCLVRATPNSDEITETVSRSFATPQVREIRVRNDIGNVLITAQGTGDVDVRVLKRSVRGQTGLDALTVDIDLDAGALTVETTLDRQALVSTRQTPTADVTITVPENHGSEIAAITSKLGDVTLLGTRGDTAVRTDVGEIVASGVDGYLSLSSRVGTILASDVTGLAAVSTELGSIKADLLGGEPSGAWIFPENTLCPDGPLAAAKLAELVADAGPLVEQVTALIGTPSVGRPSRSPRRRRSWSGSQPPFKPTTTTWIPRRGPSRPRGRLVPRACERNGATDPGDGRSPEPRASGRRLRDR